MTCDPNQSSPLHPPSAHGGGELLRRGRGGTQKAGAYIYIYVYIYTHVCIQIYRTIYSYIYIYIYIERERETCRRSMSSTFLIMSLFGDELEEAM